MRIAVITDTYHPNVNGVVKTLKRMEGYFESQGMDYRIFHPGPTREETGRSQGFFAFRLPLYPEIQCAAVPYLLFRKLVDGYRPDVLHIVTEGVLGGLALRYARERKLPYVASYTTDFSNYLEFYGLQIFTEPVKKHLEAIHKGAWTNLVPSRHSRSQLEDMGLTNLTLWGRGIETDLFRPERRDQAFRREFLGEGEGLLLFYCGRLAREKKLDVLLDMMGELQAKGLPVRLLLAGDGPCRAELEKRNVPGTHFLGFLQGEMLARAYASSDLFVFASENETYGNVILEAFASGMPVVAAYAGGVQENLVDGRNGTAILENTGSCFARAVEGLLEDGDRRRRMGLQAREDVRDRSWEALLEELAGIYREAAGSGEWEQAPGRMA
ncbi:glycosyltransferase family 4 protein [Anaerotalea alkaliphila]|uniref:Glycosyltransferase family 1 protein n=1 Tax=Anaerotalea alkaliphila TaxID=2662126 RepID=A0A7X5HUK2_9FIRM|nr:glycosyltransferase family 1 protein [Anaerotalea alkaliphila]NDL66966.1 glycosyltransferase family 1 protein [Anaerotalea alkaliphila]